MGDPKISFSGGSFTVTGYAPTWSIGNIGQVRLADYFQITPPSSFTDPQIKLGLHILDLTWGRRGSLWLEQSLTVGGTFHLLTSGASGSLQLNNQLLWQPIRDLQFTFTFVMSGQLDDTGVKGSVNFGSQFRLTDTKSVFGGVGLRF